MSMSQNDKRRKDILEKHHYNCWWVKEWFRQDLYYNYLNNKGNKARVKLKVNKLS